MDGSSMTMSLLNQKGIHQCDIISTYFPQEKSNKLFSREL